MNLTPQRQYEIAEKNALKNSISVAKLFAVLKAFNPPARFINANDMIDSDYIQAINESVITNTNENNDAVITPVITDENEKIDLDAIQAAASVITDNDAVITDDKIVTTDDKIVTTDASENNEIVITDNDLITRELYIQEYVNALKNLKTECQREFSNLRAANGNKTTILDRLKRKAHAYKEALSKYESYLNEQQLENFSAFLVELKTYPIGL